MAARRPPNRKALIRSAAAELFRDHGFHNVSVAQVAEAVGITAPALYRHYRNKRDLLLAAVLHELDTLDAIAASATDLDGLLAALAGTTVEGRGTGALWQREARHLDDHQREVIHEHSDGTMAHLVPLVGAARHELSEADSRLVALAVVGVFAGRRTSRTALSRRRHEQLLLRLATAEANAELSASNGQEAFTDAAIDPMIAGVRIPRREQLLTEAIRLFDEHGFQTVRLSDIAEAAGIARTGAYRHFANKTELLVAAATAAGDRMRLAVAQALAQARGPGEVLELLLAAHVDVTLQNARLVGILINERDQLPDPERKKYQRFQDDMLNVWLQAVDNALPGRDQREAKIVVQAVQSMVYFVIRSRSTANRRDLPERLNELGMALLQGW
ncbi:TetR family transcriptional regulator [Streptomyces sp. NPDC047315]|uniref:TetR/AcrR family transcriptional regulator n=1 Tax=Streptomyces sp. NPDC047315 TaxID=3155142 RepID=UPI003402892C